MMMTWFFDVVFHVSLWLLLMFWVFHVPLLLATIGGTCRGAGVRLARGITGWLRGHNWWWGYSLGCATAWRVVCRSTGRCTRCLGHRRLRSTRILTRVGCWLRVGLGVGLRRVGLWTTGRSSWRWRITAGFHTSGSTDLWTRSWAKSWLRFRHRNS